MDLFSLLIYIIIFGCVAGLLWYLVTILPIPEPIKGFVRIAFIVVCVLVLVFWLLSMVGGGPVIRFR